MKQKAFLLIFEGYHLVKNRSSHAEVFLGEDVLKIYGKFTVEHPFNCLNMSTASSSLTIM